MVTRQPPRPAAVAAAATSLPSPPSRLGHALLRRASPVIFFPFSYTLALILPLRGSTTAVFLPFYDGKADTLRPLNERARSSF